MQVKKHNEDWNRLPKITSKYFCDHIDELLDRVAQEKISFQIVDSGTGVEVIVCPLDGVHHQAFASFAEQMEQYYGVPSEEIRKNVRWGCTEEGWEEKE